VDAREERLAQNEVLFREVNERIEQAAETQVTDEHTFSFLCECSDIDCSLRVPMTLTAYREVRSDPTLFVVLPGHERTELERVVRQTADYEVVRKEGEAAAIAVEQDDPRS
jgi:hypothetical protein